jgi:hypothetical protein
VPGAPGTGTPGSGRSVARRRLADVAVNVFRVTVEVSPGAVRTWTRTPGFASLRACDAREA